jgi:type IV pilus assembly protein PilQ
MMTANQINSNDRGNQAMTKRISHIVTRSFSLVVLFAMAGLSATAQAATLDNISYSVLPGERVQLQIELSEPMVGEPLNFTIDNPARIALDFPNTKLGSVKKSQSIDVGVAHSVSAVEAAGRTRVVLNLVQSVPYEIDVQGSSVIVTLGASAVITGDALSGGAPSSLLSSMSNVGGTGSSIEGIDFRRGDAGEGRVIVTLSDPSISVDMNQVGGKIVLDFIGASDRKSVV